MCILDAEVVGGHAPAASDRKESDNLDGLNFGTNCENQKTLATNCVNAARL